MIVDALMLAGSIKRNKVALMVGLILSGKVILGLVVLTIWNFTTTYYVFVVLFTLLTIGLRLWTFLIGVQCYRSIGVGTLPKFELLENWNENIDKLILAWLSNKESFTILSSRKRLSGSGEVWFRTVRPRQKIKESPKVVKEITKSFRICETYIHVTKIDFYFVTLYSK